MTAWTHARRFATAGAVVVGLTRAAGAMTFQFTGQIETYVVPTAGAYRVTVAGAQGGSGSGGAAGGLGATVSGEVALPEGMELYVAVGGRALQPRDRTLDAAEAAEAEAATSPSWKVSSNGS